MAGQQGVHQKNGCCAHNKQQRNEFNFFTVIGVFVSVSSVFVHMCFFSFVVGFWFVCVLFGAARACAVKRCLARRWFARFCVLFAAALVRAILRKLRRLISACANCAAISAISAISAHPYNLAIILKPLDHM